MLSKFYVTAILVLTFAVSIFAADDKEESSLNGTWLPETAEIAGKPFPEEVRKQLKLVIDGDKYTVTAGKSVDKGTLKVKEDVKPKQMEITGGEGTILAIYEHNGDTLKVCYLMGSEYPKEFKSTAENLCYLITYKRAKE